MRKISVHFEYVLIVFRKRISKTRNVSRTKALLFLSLEEVNSIFRLVHLGANQICSTVRTIVVDYEDVKIPIKSQNGIDNILDVSLLVVGWNYDQTLVQLTKFRAKILELNGRKTSASRRNRHLTEISEEASLARYKTVFPN